MVNQNNKSHNFSAAYSKLLIFIISVLAVVQIFMANSLSVQGKEIGRFEGFKGDIEKDINSLKQRSATLSSLETIRSQAKQKLNMVEGFDSFDYFGASVALR